MREYLSDVVGNAALRARLGDELERGALSHAYILEGAPGCGKHTLARAIVMALACEQRGKQAPALPCGHCPTCQKIAAGNCPDVLTVRREPDKATMGVEVIRALRADVAVLPNDLEFKVYVVEDADTMTTQAQNALLLTLEEPPPFVLFLLLATQADTLLETIRSRAPVLRMQPQDDATMRAYLLDEKRPAVARAARAVQAASQEEFDALLRMANGRIGRALELLEEKKRTPVMARRADVAELCRLLGETGSTQALLAHLRGFGKSREELSARFTLMLEALRDLTVLCCAEEAPLVFFTDRDQALELSARFTVAGLLGIVQETKRTLDALGANANTRLALTHYFCRLTANT